MIVALAAFEQGELARVVHHGELVEQRLDDLAGPRAGADVQVFGRVLGQVEGGAALHRRGPPGPLLGRGRLAGRGNGHGPHQLKLHLDEARVRAVFVLREDSFKQRKPD